MFGLIVAFLLLLTNLALIHPDKIPTELQPWIIFYQDHQSDILLFLVIFYLALYLLARRRLLTTLETLSEQLNKTQEKSNLSSAAILDENNRLKKTLRDLQKSVDTSQKELTEERETKLALQRALTDTKKKLEHQEHLHSARDPRINAEIINLIALFQAKGRFIDFLKDDITPFDDAQIGRAARVVHQGCRSVLDEYFKIETIHRGKEGDEIVLDANHPVDMYRLVGRVSGTPPYRGRVLHLGWKSTSISLPRVNSSGLENNELIIAPTEVEI